ncbi:hypothetical protein SBRY_50131 [Actinacidiphila bryophytorum]|uniref:Uncharacterized protein n=1 Tax=Actinacidiphila bryophytorum TaxID=1436133 RepID=A0A9W4H4D4_9ACTN|nr:hypothetical protein SBRY_50131 [Actinacidiphila bryophytorum]
MLGHRRQERHPPGVPDLRRHRAGLARRRWRLLAHRPVRGLQGPRPDRRDALRRLPRQRAGQELAHHAGPHPRRGDRRAADQAARQGRTRRARRPRGRPVRGRARRTAPGLRPQGRQPHGDRAGQLRGGGARRRRQGADAGRPPGHPQTAPGHSERPHLAGARQGRGAQGRVARRPAGHRRGGGAGEDRGQGAGRAGGLPGGDRGRRPAGRAVQGGKGSVNG